MEITFKQHKKHQTGASALHVLSRQMCLSACSGVHCKQKIKTSCNESSYIHKAAAETVSHCIINKQMASDSSSQRLHKKLNHLIEIPLQQELFEDTDQLLEGRELPPVQLHQLHRLQSVGHVEADVDLDLGVLVGQLDDGHAGLVEHLGRHTEAVDDTTTDIGCGRWPIVK